MSARRDQSGTIVWPRRPSAAAASCAYQTPPGRSPESPTGKWAWITRHCPFSLWNTIVERLTESWPLAGLQWIRHTIHDGSHSGKQPVVNDVRVGGYATAVGRMSRTFVHGNADRFGA